MKYINYKVISGRSRSCLTIKTQDGRLVVDPVTTHIIIKEGPEIVAILPARAIVIKDTEVEEDNDPND